MPQAGRHELSIDGVGMRLPRVGFLLTELRQAGKMTCDLRGYLTLLSSTVLYHLGNRFQTLISNNLRRISCRTNGRRLSLAFRQNPADIRVLYEVLGAHIYRAPYNELGTVETVVDLGAHIGCATLYFGTLFPSARLIAVEPVTENFDLLRSNCQRNGVTPSLFNRCIGPASGKGKLYRDRSSYQYSMHEPVSGGSGSPSLEVETMTMDAITAECALRQIDILKVDIEGAESALFAECASWISRVRLIIIEIHPTLVDYSGVIRAITKNGFRYFPPGTFAPACDVFLRDDLAGQVQRTR